MERATLITGGNSGIGAEAARELARSGRRLLLASRNLAATEQTARNIREETPGAQVEALRLDLGSFAAIRQFAKEVEARDLAIDTLVCNAGLQMSDLVLSTDGYETTLAVNHLGHFLLTNLLLARLASHSPARIVVVASGVHDPARSTGMPKPRIAGWDTLFAAGGPDLDVFHGRLAYVNSKLCNLWFTYELVRRLEAKGLLQPTGAVAVNAYEPGLVPGSGLARNYPPTLRWIWNRVGPGFGRLASRYVAGINTPEGAGAALARVVSDPALEAVSGKYFPSHTRFEEARSSDASYEEARAASLWEESVRVTGLEPGESPLG